MFKKYILILLIQFPILNAVEALNSPILHCISVNNNGSVTLDWSKPTDISGFSNYYIYRSNSATAAFIKIDSISNINQLTYIDNSINANIQSYYYYVNCKTTTNAIINPNDTLQSIFLSVTNLGTGVASLNWNAIRIPLLSSSSSKYYIYNKKGNSPIWVNIDSTSNLFYNDTINVCADTVYYRIEISDYTGCISVSSVDKEFFEDNIAPVTFGLDSVSVNISTGKVVLGWKPSSSNDVMGYIICHGSPCLALDTIWGRFNTFYSDSLYNPCDGSQSYRIAVFDSCYNTSLFSSNQNTIFLTSVYSKCENKIYLNWTPYINMNPPLSGYKVKVSKNGGQFYTVATLSNNTLNYVLDNLQDSTIYCVYIEAFENSGNITSSSCEKCYTIIKSLNPSVLYLSTVSVSGNNQIDVKFFTDPSVYINGYKLYKSNSISGSFTQITSIPYSGNANFSYSDYNVSPKSELYYYKIQSVDSCGNIGITSNISHNILLTGSTFDSYTNKLEWCTYDNWAGDVDNFEIFRSVNGIFSPAPIAIIAAIPANTTYQFFDNIESYITGNGKFEYYIKANEKANSIYNFIEWCKSNVIEIVQQPEMFIPNAFSPEGVNKIFKPVMAFVNNENYSMQIFNRYGQLIFDNNNPELGWDGRYLGEYVNQGVYVYVIRYSLPNKEIVQKSGIVTVVF